MYSKTALPRFSLPDPMCDVPSTPDLPEAQLQDSHVYVPVGVTGCCSRAGVIDDLQLDLIGRRPQFETAGRLASL
jgi:hypothetical protein